MADLVTSGGSHPGAANLSPILTGLERAGIPVNPDLEVVHIESNLLTARYRTPIGERTLRFALVRK